MTPKLCFGMLVLRFVLWQFGSGKSGIFILDAQPYRKCFGAERVRINKLLGTWRVTKRLSARKAGRRGSNLFSIRPVVEAAGSLLRQRRCSWKPPGRLRDKDHCGQATKGVWRMSWRQKAKKGVEGCDKLGGAVKQALIPGFPNDRAPNP